MNTNEICQEKEQEIPQYKGTATYSPEDNKLRFYPFARLSREDYARIKAASFIWAPKQGFFVAPAWTPERADLLQAWAGEVGDEDSTLMQRAEERAERFEGYSERRGREAEAAHAAVSRIADGIPLGQPILVGHHSERRHRNDIERMDNGMRKTVKLWETRDYWKARAAAAQCHADYKERPDVRYRRIKGLEADQRKHERAKQEAEMWLKLWLDCEAEQDASLQQAVALRIAGMCHLRLPRKEEDSKDHDGTPTAYDALTNSHPRLYAPRTLAEVVESAKRAYPSVIAYADRWIAHFDNRIAYERAMLESQGGLIAQAADIQPGGRVRARGRWRTVIRVNRKNGKPVSVSATDDSGDFSVRGIEEIEEYQAPTDEGAARAAKINALPPLVNYPGEGFASMTRAQYNAIPKDYKGTTRIEATKTAAAHRVRGAFATFARLDQDVDRRHASTNRNVFITDAKRVDPPALDVATS